MPSCPTCENKFVGLVLASQTGHVKESKEKINCNSALDLIFFVLN